MIGHCNAKAKGDEAGHRGGTISTFRYDTVPCLQSWLLSRNELIGAGFRAIRAPFFDTSGQGKRAYSKK